MPITAFQQRVLTLLKSNRSPDSYVAGGTAIQRNSESLRYSEDIDIFHDTDKAVTDAFQSDRATLLAAGYSVETQISQPSYYRSTIGKDGQYLKLEWVRDTAFRFFPVVEDNDLGYRLHDIDLAINKCLALANRSVVRDALDIIELDRKLISLPAMISGACGKDPGFTPILMIEMMQRHMTFTPHELAAESLTKPIDPVKLKKDLLKLVDRTRKVIDKLSADEIGCIFVDKEGRVLKELTDLDRKKHRAHFGSVKGSWPRIVND
jgi:hypothetical protein